MTEPKQAPAPLRKHGDRPPVSADIARSRRTPTPRRQGGAYVEALVVLPLFALVCAAVLLVGRGYDALVSAEQNARSAAWSDAMSGCAQPHASEAIRRELRAVSQRGAEASTTTRGVVDALRAGLAHGLGEAEAEASAPAPLGPRSVRRSIRLACNERPDPSLRQPSTADAEAFVRDALSGR